MNSCPPSPVLAAGRRIRSRLRTRLPARLTTIYGTYSALLLDLSLTGGRIRLSNRHGIVETPSVGSALVLEWCGFDAFGDVAWVDADTIGIVFDQIITPATLIATRDLEDGTPRRDREHQRTMLQARDFVEGKGR